MVLTCFARAKTVCFMHVFSSSGLYTGGELDGEARENEVQLKAAFDQE